MADILASEIDNSQVSYIRIQAWLTSGDSMEVHIIDPIGSIIARGSGRTLGRALFSAALNLTGHDAIDFMDAINQGR